MVNETKARVKEKIERVGRALQSENWITKPGWGQRPKSQPDVWTTAQIVYLLRFLQSSQHINVPAEIISSALEFIIQKQNANDGGWGLEDSSPPVTATILMVLSSEPVKYDAEIKQGLRFMANSKNKAQGGWGALHQPESATHVTSLIVDCLNSVQLMPNIAPNLIKVEHLDPARDFLLKRQNSDGGWGEFTNSISDAKQTAYAVYALARVFKNNEAALEAIAKGIKWLKRNYQASGGFWGGGKGDVEATTIAVWALISVGEPYASPIILKSIKYLLENSTQENNIVGWGIYPNESIQSWLTFFVMISLTMFLEAIDTSKKISVFGRLSILFQDRKFTNFLSAAFILVAIALLASVFIVSVDSRNFLLIIGAILGAFGVIIKFINQSLG